MHDRDLLRRVDGALKITGRKVTVDQNVLLAENVSIYFWNRKTPQTTANGRSWEADGRRPIAIAAIAS